MSQRPGCFYVRCGRPGKLPDWTEMFVWPNCRQMVADIDALLDTSGFSFRDRRQVLLAEVWRLVQEGHDDLTFTIRGHMGSPRNLEFLQTQAAGPT